MAKYRYTMKVTADYLLDLVEAAIGRRPDGVGKSGLHSWSVTFDEPDLTAQQRADLKAALPDWLRVMYSFSREEVADEEG